MKVIRILIPIYMITALVASPCIAGLYSGIPIFDRWGGSLLYSGVYVMYVSEKVKDRLKPYEGEAIQIDAQKVYKYMVPGDRRIEKFKYFGAAPENRNKIPIEGLELKTVFIDNSKNEPWVKIVITNAGKNNFKVFSYELALTLLMKRQKTKNNPKFVSDGPSYALITRDNFSVGDSEPRWKNKGVSFGNPYSWSIGKDNALPHTFTMLPQQRREVIIKFVLPEGEYDFLSGYGGGVLSSECVASNLTAFNVNTKRKAKFIKIKTR